MVVRVGRKEEAFSVEEDGGREGIPGENEWKMNRYCGSEEECEEWDEVIILALILVLTITSMMKDPNA